MRAWRSNSRCCLVAATLAVTLLTRTGAFLLGPGRLPAAAGVRRAAPVCMAREWLSDAFSQLSDVEIDRIHKYIDNKGKTVIRGPATVAGPDGNLLNVAVDEEVEILDGIVFRTYLNMMPPVNEARLKAENSVMLEIRWRENWETEGFTIEVFGATGPECLEYTNRFCQATGCRIAGDIQCKAAYYEVPLEVTNDKLVMKLQALQAGTGTLEL